MNTEIHVAERVYAALQQTLEQVREPGKSALVIPLVTYAQEMGIGIDTLRKMLIRLRCEHRISARKLDYPGGYPEAWEIVFIEANSEERRQFLEDTAGDVEYTAYIEHLHRPRVSDY